MALRHLNRRKYKRIKETEKFLKYGKKGLSEGAIFSTGFNSGYNNAIKWIMRKLKLHSVTELNNFLQKNETLR